MTIIEPTNNFKMSRKPNKAEAALMHPLQNIIALKAKSEAGAGHIVQVKFIHFFFILNFLI